LLKFTNLIINKNAMKKIAIIAAFAAVMACAGVAYASTAEVLQPTSDGVVKVSSLHVGEEGVGGVTYFNGSIVNIGEDIPVTIADDLRVDGVISRGFGPVKVADDIVIQGDLTVEGMANIGASKISSHWLNSDGVQANYVLRLPHDTQAPTGECETGNLYGDVSAGTEGLYLCNEDNAWVAL
jgi:hypothetical protein